MKRDFSRRGRLYHPEEPWVSFSDLFATACLVFIFVALVVVITSIRILNTEMEQYRGMREELRVEMERNAELQETLTQERARLLAAQMGLDDIAQVRNNIYGTVPPLKAFNGTIMLRSSQPRG